MKIRKAGHFVIPSFSRQFHLSFPGFSSFPIGMVIFFALSLPIKSLNIYDWRDRS
jgi:hypothetical protein